jgi:hypothetical protein
MSERRLAIDCRGSRVSLAVPVDDCARRQQARRSGERELVDGKVEQRWRKRRGLESDDKPYHSSDANRTADNEK